MIVILLHERPYRFGELHTEIDGISKKVLTDTLRALERDGMVSRDVDRAGHYGLTALGASLHEPLCSLQRWAEAHMDELLHARNQYDERADSAILDQARI